MPRGSAPAMFGGESNFFLIELGEIKLCLIELGEIKLCLPAKRFSGPAFADLSAEARFSGRRRKEYRDALGAR